MHINNLVKYKYYYNTVILNKFCSSSIFDTLSFRVPAWFRVIQTFPSERSRLRGAHPSALSVPVDNLICIYTHIINEVNFVNRHC
jgi:hypothetical protein